MICMFAPNFEAIGHVTLVLESENAPKVWRKKRSQAKTAQVRQKIFHRVVCFKIPFHLNQPTFGRDEVCFFFFPFFSFFFSFFFFLMLIRSSSPKPQHIEI